MKSIKFDLPMNGQKIRSLDVLQDNITAEILLLFREGRLLRWLDAFGYLDEANNIRELPDGNDQELLIKIGAALGVAIDISIANFLIQPQSPIAVQSQEFVSEPKQSSLKTEEVTGFPAIDFDTPPTLEQLLLFSESDIPYEMQEIAIKDGYPQTRIALADNKKTHPDLLRKLFTLNDRNINISLAGNESTPEDIQLLLFENSDSLINKTLASNPQLSKLLLEKLIDLNEENIKKEIASNPCLSEDKQNFLYTTGNIQIRQALAKNQNLSHTIQARIIGTISQVIDELAKNPSLRDDLFSQLVEYHSDALALNPALPVMHQKALAVSMHRGVRLNLYLNQNLKPTLFHVIEKSFSKEDIEFISERLLATKEEIKHLESWLPSIEEEKHTHSRPDMMFSRQYWNNKSLLDSKNLLHKKKQDEERMEALITSCTRGVLSEVLNPEINALNNFFKL